MEKTNIGVIGCGVIANVYLNNIKKFYKHLKVVACADIFAEKAKAMAQKYDIETVYTVAEILMAKEVDIILNLTIPAVHYELNKKAILNKKNIYCEKPLALKVKDAIELKELARENGVMLGCAPDTFMGTALQTCRRLIDEGWIGTPIGATANMVNHGPETWHPAPDFFYQEGGGPLLDMGPYYITALVSLLGPVARAGCFMTKGFAKRKIYSQPRCGEEILTEVPTHYAGLLRFENEVVANITMSFDGWLTNLPKLEIYGTKGTLVIPDPNHFGGEIKLVRAEELIEEVEGFSNEDAIGKLSRPEMWQKYKVMPHLYRQPDSNMRGLGLADMASALKLKRQNRASADMACHVTEVLEALNYDGEFQAMQTTCTRPELIPIGLDVGQFD
jgi:Predicted dehydrogenases and related proteins